MFQTKPYSQTDPAWKDTLLGFDRESTIGQFGCLLTCLAMVANGFGANETPVTLNEKLKGVGGFIGPLVIPGALPAVAAQVKYSKRIQCNNPPAPLGEIDNALSAGEPVIVKVDYSPVPGVQDHWIVLVEKQGGDYLILDPWPFPAETRPVLLTSRYGFAGGPERIILDTLFFSAAAAPKPKPPVARKPIPANALIVYATADGLALRTQPLVNDQTLIERVGLGAKLIVLDDPAAARGTVGKLNHWLQVQVDGDGQQGYAAAWYVSQTAPGSPQPPVGPIPPQPQPQALVVYAAADGLAFRSQPLVSEASLIRRVPLNTQFSVADPAEQAKARIGVTGQWIKVKDVAGAVGYVAAWFVALEPANPPLGATPTPPSPPTPPPPAGQPMQLIVRTTDAWVALRSQPVVSPLTLVKRMPAGAELEVLEPAESAEAKIGVVNQWIQVRDIDGSKGFVAAWFVVKTPRAVTALTQS